MKIVIEVSRMQYHLIEAMAKENRATIPGVIDAALTAAVCDPGPIGRYLYRQPAQVPGSSASGGGAGLRGSGGRSPRVPSGGSGGLPRGS